jgi:GH25 family lysozyme M1 (1,4-beta-N-acetylmuramidase)
MSMITPGPRPTTGPWGVDLHAGRQPNAAQWTWLADPNQGGCKFAIMKDDGSFEHLVNESIRRGIEPGAYHFLVRGDVHTQAAAFVTKVRPFLSVMKHQLIGVDIEDSAKHVWKAAERPYDSTLQFLNIVHDQLGIYGDRYSYPSFWNKWKLGEGALAAHYRAWAASYKRDQTWADLDKLFHDEVACWQYGGGPIPGGPGSFDKNLYRGTW